MLSNLKQRKSEGFTIIEVMIVLAIAGLIMLIVFLAVPALQRNSRNTQYKNDAASILSAASEWSNNHNGDIPASGDSGDILDLTKTKSITNLTIDADQSSATPTFDEAFLITGVKCDTANGDSYNLTGSATRAMALIYAIEDSTGSVVAQCTES